MKQSKKTTSRGPVASKPRLENVAHLTLSDLQAIKRERQASQRANPPRTAEEAESRLLLKPARIRNAKVRWPEL